jgi:hypothetical protein
MGSRTVFAYDWPGTVILLVSASQVARMTGVSHWCPAWVGFDRMNFLFIMNIFSSFLESLAIFCLILGIVNFPLSAVGHFYLSINTL